MQLKPENYKGHVIKFAEKVLPNGRLVVGETPSKVTGRIIGTSGLSKDFVLGNIKKMIDRETKVKGL